MKKRENAEAMVLFTVDSREFTWGEVEIAARLWGEWDSFASQTGRDLASFEHARASASWPSSGEVQRAADEFRRARRLISAEETADWLAEWGLRAEDLTDYIRRRLIVGRGKPERITSTSPQTVNGEEMAVAIRADALLSGKLAEWARRLAGQAAISANRSGGGPGESGSKHQWIAEIDSAFRAFSTQAVSRQALQARISKRQLDWIRCDCRYLWFGEERPAREAALCLIEDGISMEDLAYRAHSVVQEWSFCLDEVEPWARGHFLAARPGDRLGPLNLLFGFPVFSLVNKKLPVADDPRIVERATRAVIGSAVKQAVSSRVRWVARL